jgi:hypothetical protein
MTALKVWDQTANNGNGDWVSLTLTQQNNVKISTEKPNDTSQLWADPNDVSYTVAIDGGSA